MKGKAKAADYLLYDPASGTYREDPEQAVRDDVEKHYWLHVGRTILKDWRLYVMLVPMLLVFLFWRYLPMYELLGAFKVPDEVLPVAQQDFSGFSYFKELLVGGQQVSTDFWRALRNTFLLSFYGLCFGFPMPIILALFFNEVRSNIGRSALQVMTYLPKFMSTVVMTSLVTMLVKQQSLTTNMGIISQLLVDMGHIVTQLLSGLGDWLNIASLQNVTVTFLSQETAAAGLLNNPDFFRGIYQISGIWEGAGYDSIVFFAAIIAISPTSYEAAQIDGAGKMAQMRYVVLPSIISTIVIMLITRIGSLLNIGYEKVLLLYNDKTYVTADVVSTFAQRHGIEGTRKGLASAAEMMNNVIGMMLVIGANKIAQKASNVSLY
ncbi:MAG: sugar ABC transporter permease [Clostridia bacterium]|nr:sugar ABC transporter permease [Clostridia bacterium]